MAEFAAALPWVLSHEVIGWPVHAGRLEQDIAQGMARVQASCAQAGRGVAWWYSNDPADPGGPTAWGITLSLAQHHGLASADDLHAIQPHQVQAIYRTEFWRFDGLRDQRLATKALDLVVNLGPRRGVKLLQEALRTLGAELAVDGLYGTHTEQAANTRHPEILLATLASEATDYYGAQSARNPASARFLKGWLARAAELPPC